MIKKTPLILKYDKKPELYNEEHKFIPIIEEHIIINGINWDYFLVPIKKYTYIKKPNLPKIPKFQFKFVLWEKYCNWFNKKFNGDKK